jgi:hypothetical protein
MGIAIPGGLDFICHTTQAQLQLFMPTPQQSQRALLMLDITNMFNAVSRDACRHILQTNPALQPLLPFFDLLYSVPNTCWYRTPDQTHNSFQQPEGFTQGCPLSGVFADLVLSLVLQPINIQLEARYKSRHPNSPHPPPFTASYHDDTSVILPYEDIPWFLNTFEQLGRPLGIHLNKQKTKILTSLTDESPLPYLTANNKQALIDTLTILGPQAQLTSGTCLLGQPIGSSDFALRFLLDKTQSLDHTINKQLPTRIKDLQTQMAILKHCAIPAINHLLAMHYYHHAPDSPVFQPWHSQVTYSILSSVHHYIASITQLPFLPYHAQTFLHIPASLGGIGLRDPTTATIPSFITSISRSL